MSALGWYDPDFWYLAQKWLELSLYFQDPVTGNINTSVAVKSYKLPGPTKYTAVISEVTPFLKSHESEIEAMILQDVTSPVNVQIGDGGGQRLEIIRTKTKRGFSFKPAGLRDQLNVAEPRRIFNTLVVLLHLMDLLSPGHHWRTRLKELFGKHRNVSLTQMGFPPNYLEFPLWKT